MNNKTFLFVLISLAFGVLAVFLARNWLESNSKSSSSEATSAVITMAAVIPQGAILKRQNLKLMPMPNSVIPETAIKTFKDAEGMVVKHNLYTGEILRSERIIKKGEGSTLASLISPNMRAVTIRVNDVVGVAGFLLPGNRVDVLNLFKKDGTLHTEIVLDNIKILAIDQHSSNDENKPKLVRAVTLELDLEQAKVLLIAKGRGKLQLALRNPNDSAKVELVSINQKELGEEEVVSSIVKPPIKKEVRVVYSDVYLIKGMKEQVVRVSN
ncbi:Flp pilus assembly protein CpaB [Shewanella surugensis]|uniref:Flp pilus assembly protein CpaB n=1 Tax=Shewanella surugensis TaxID=212020 RepID=A0ABT0LG13_9GAMM|nr:Flp pilus assembly protein CpaB [Shewanella surugensis]MCL1126605.1 Flp pilus assembly protein CpaB [Shewanella surugensis]